MTTFLEKLIASLLPELNHWSLECFIPISFVVVPFKIKKRQQLGYPAFVLTPRLAQGNSTVGSTASMEEALFDHLDLDAIKNGSSVLLMGC